MTLVPFSFLGMLPNTESLSFALISFTGFLLPPEPPDVPSSETVPSREMSISSRSAISSSPPLSEAVLSASLPLPQPTADKHRNTASISDNNLIIFLFIIILLTFISLKDWIVIGTT